MGKMKHKKGSTAAEEKCGNCILFGKSACQYEEVEEDDEPCKKFSSADDYKEIETRQVKIDSEKTVVKMVAYTWKGGDPRIKMITVKTGQKGKEYVSKEWPRCSPADATKIAVGLRKLAQKFEE